MRRSLLLTLPLALAGLRVAPAAQSLTQAPLPAVEWDQNLGAQVPLARTFVDQDGRRRRLDDVIGERPVILALVYYECPMLCNLVMEGVARCLKPLSFDVGEEFDVVALSIDPGETSAQGLERKQMYLERYGRPETADGWTFLTGAEEDIAAVAEAVGFGFTYVPETDEYAHAAGITVLTPAGRVSHYFYGIEYSTRDLRLALVESSDGKVGNPVDKVLLRCFQYDPTEGRYGLAILSSIRLAGLLTVGVLGTFVVRMLLRERRTHALTVEGASS